MIDELDEARRNSGLSPEEFLKQMEEARPKDFGSNIQLIIGTPGKSVWMSYADWQFEQKWIEEQEAKLGVPQALAEFFDKIHKAEEEQIANMTTNREQQEQELSDKYLNQIVSFKSAKGTTSVGKVKAFALWPKDGEETVHIQIANKLHTIGLEYFEDNIIIL